MEAAPTTYTKAEILQSLSEAFEKVDALFGSMQETHFQKSVGSKWSPAEQLKHLVLSTDPLTLGLNLPKAALLIFGRNKGKSKSYDTVVQDYKAKLALGATATFLYTPKKLKTTREKLMGKWKKAYGKLLNAIGKWTENDLDKYQLKHPILGKMTVREMLFFTIYHTHHHTHSITDIINHPDV